jgi:hypothetical protein
MELTISTDSGYVRFLLRATLIGLVILIMVAGAQTRPRADDLCIAAGTMEKGVFGYTQFMYDTWTGRWAYLLTHSILSSTEPYTSALLPAFLLTGLIAAWSWATGRFWLVMSAAVIWASIAPNLDETLFWSAGSLVYAFPVILIGVLAGMIRRKWHWAGLALVAFIAGGYIETLDLLLCIVLAVIWTISPRYRREILVVIFFTVLSLVIVYIAPGNAIRNLYFPQARQFIPALGIAYYNMSEYLLLSLRWIPLLLCLAWMTAGELGNQRHLRYRAGWATVVMILFLIVIYVACFTTGYAQAAGPPPRMLMMMNVWLIVTCMIWGLLAGKKPRWAQAVCTVVLAIWCIHWLQSIPAAHALAVKWDSRHEALVSARGALSVTVPVIGGVGDFLPDPSNWVNECAARWYHVGAIVAEEGLGDVGSAASQ